MDARRKKIEQARSILKEAAKMPGDENDSWVIRNCLLSLSMLKAPIDKEQPKEHRHD